MTAIRATRTSFAILAAGLTATALTACGTNSGTSTTSAAGGASSSAGTTSAATDTASSGGGSAAGGKIALLLPESKTTRYESFDRPLFEAAVKADCADCEVLYSNADQDAAKQQQQAEAAITNGADVMVLDPVDAKSAAAIVTKANQANVPVVSYDRLIANSKIDYYISFDNEAVGKL